MGFRFRILVRVCGLVFFPEGSGFWVFSHQGLVCFPLSLSSRSSAGPCPLVCACELFFSGTLHHLPDGLASGSSFVMKTNKDAASTPFGVLVGCQCAAV